MALDAEVARQVAAGDLAGAVTRAISALGPGVLGYFRSVLRDPDEADDAFSEWSERLLRGLPAFEYRASLRSWGARLAVHVAIDLRGRANRRPRRFATGELSQVAAPVRTSITARLDRERTVRTLSAELGPEQQTLLFLRVNQGLSWEEIASILEAAGHRGSPAAIEKRYTRLLASLRRRARKKRLIL
jgi:RNA polymerase sigma-70 factor (ECF subfamily)